MRTRDLEGRWYDVFADWDFADQAAALKVLEALHRQKARSKRQIAAVDRKIGPEDLQCIHGVSGDEPCDKCEAAK